MNVELINPFLKATSNVLETMTQTKPVSGQPVVKANTRTFGVVTGIIGMAGDHMTGNLLISFDEPSVLGSVSRMLMEQFTEVSQDVVDAVGEMTNMICGGAKRELSEAGYSFELASPMVVTGRDLELQQMAKSPILVIPFSTPEGSFVVETNLAKKNGGV